MENKDLITVADQLSVVHQSKELKPSKIGDENKFIVARSFKSIIHAPEEDLNNSLKIVMLKVGLRVQNLPDEVEKMVLIDHIVQHYGNHTAPEIILAFDMAIAGRLNLPANEINCYENFSCLYFSKIMNAYRQWSKQVHEQLAQPVSNLLQEHKPTPEEQRESMIAWIEEWKVMEEINFDMIPVIFYDFLEKEKMIVLGSKEKWNYTDRAMNEVKALLQKDLDLNLNSENHSKLESFLKMESEGKFTGQFYSMIVNRAKKIAIFDYLKNSEKGNKAYAVQG